ncbi:regulatory protein GemA [Asaia sp. W19]|uniref:regulatory protein GemA n=1 Tax=unclassified Asaia TaxID=2685023 RepID=UPI000F8C8E1E|nr:regulatory protein GemA [Asaia sp. W19]RUT27377.1 regulatory protein GemA [Asaia sp. W19]
MTRRPHLVQHVSANTGRNVFYVKLHVARKELALDEDSYRDILQRVGGSYHAKDMSISGLEAVLAEFKRLGWKPKPGKRRTPDSVKAQVRMIYALWKDLEPYVRSSDKLAALRSFVLRQTRTAANPQGVSAPEFLDAAQANRVIEGLKDWLRREKEKQP